MSRAAALARLKEASADLTNARRSLADAQFCQRHGLANNLMFAQHVEHTTYHRWLRAHAAFTHTR